MVAGTCPRCDATVALHEGRPFVNADGAVELWHRDCFEDRDVLVTRSRPEDFLPTPPTPRVVRALGGLIAGSMVVAIGVGHWTIGEAAPPPATVLAPVDLSVAEPIELRAAVTAHEHMPSRLYTVDTELEARFPVPVDHGARLDETFPSLRGWTHPVTRSAELLPDQASRRFGSRREGIDRPECGEGHCGVDLDGPRGRPLVAVAAGTVVRVELAELGLDGKSGRYVRVEHDDGTLTAYMHLDDVAALRVGDRVLAGQYVGTLGATAVFQSVPHLHFSVEVPRHPGQHGDNTDTRYVDPAPYLVRAAIVSAPVDDRDRRGRPRPTKPAS